MRGFAASAPYLLGAAVLVLVAAAALLALAEPTLSGTLGLPPAAVMPALLALSLLVAAVLAFTARSADRHDRLTGGAGFSSVTGGLAIAGLFGSAATLLLPGLVHQHGFDGLIPLLGIAGGLLLMQVIVGPALARAGAATLPDLVGRRFGRLARALTLLVAAGATAGLLLAELTAATSIAARVFDVPAASAAALAIPAILLLVLPGGMRSAAAAGALGSLLAMLALIGGLAIVTFALLGNPFPQLAYGAALPEIAASELALIEGGLVDFGVFKPFLREFLTVDSLNWSLLTLALMAAIAAQPPLVQATGLFPARATRRGTALALTFTVLLLTAVPALATLVRLETYRVVAAGQVFAHLPVWVRNASAADALRIHGVSLGLVEDAGRAVAAGADGLAAVSAAMAARGPRQDTHWQRLDPAVQEAVLATARSFAGANGTGADPAERWPQFAASVLPAAALAAGNDTGKPTLAALAIDPELMALAVPQAAGLPRSVSALAIAAVLGAAVALAALLVATLSGMLVHDTLGVVRRHAAPGRADAVPTALTAILVTALGAGAAVLMPVPADVLLISSLSLAAAGLLPALVLAIWVPRANAFGLLAALVTGLGVCAYYLLGTSLYGVSFYETWSALSNAGGEAFAEFEEARELWLMAEGADRAAAYADLAGRAAGSLWSPGLANWYGVAPAAAPVLAIPLALLVGIAVSLLTPRPKETARAVFDRIHGGAIAPHPGDGR